MVFINVYIQFRIRTWIRIRNLELLIRIRQKVSDPYESESKTLRVTIRIHNTEGQDPDPTKKVRIRLNPDPQH
jgi:hypothetical protein